MDNLLKFVEFFQRATGLRLSPMQEKIAKFLFREAGDFLQAGTGKTTFFDQVEAYVAGENEQYETRAALQEKILKLESELSDARVIIATLQQPKQ